MFALKKGNVQPRYIQKGLREKLLCDKCENLFANQYEAYFAKLWYRNKRTIPKTTNKDFVDIKNVDYTLFKLFHLSVLWRASISSLEPFKEVSLGKEQEERLRQMLLAGDSGMQTEYQILGVLLVEPETNKVFDGLIMSPIVLTHKGVVIYMFVFGGCAWHYVAGNQWIDAFAPASLSPEGKIALRVRDFLHLTPITRFFKEEVSRMKFPPSKHTN
ncbi:MAG: hypothetical protein ACT4QE_07120 [Anaerolineales bacterium]